jgi:hypothetical protein
MFVKVQKHIDDGGKDVFHEAYALQLLVEYAIKNKSYIHLSDVKFDDENNPLVDKFDIICCTYNDPIFGYLRTDDGEDVLVYSTNDGLKMIHI